MKRTCQSLGLPGLNRSAVATLLASAVIAAPLWAASPVPINNPGFEDPAQTDGNFTGTATGWSNVGSANDIGVFNPTTNDFTTEAPEGENVGYIFGGVVDAGLSQVLTSNLQADASYTLTVQVGNSKSYDYDGYRLQLLAGGTLLAEDDNSLSPASDAFVTATVNYPYNAGLHAALVGQPLEIRLLGKGVSGGSAGETEFDEVQLTVTLANPVAVPGGPYAVAIPDGSLSLDGGASLPSDGETITTWEWDLDNDGDFDELVTGVTPASIDYATLTAAPPVGYGMVEGDNTIKLRVTDSAAKTSTVEGTVKIRQPLLIYEPFDDPDPTLNGNTPGLGLTGTWNPGESRVADGSLTYGKLGYQGGRAVTNPGDQVDVNGISPGTTLTDAGLMDDGATLWFSVLIVKHPDTSVVTNDRTTYFSLGTGPPDGFDRIGGTPGSGFAVVINQNNGGLDRLQGWNDDSDGAGGAFRSPLVSYAPEGETILAVGKITWGEFNITDDVFELYVPDKDLNLGSPVSTLNGNFDQLGTVNPDNAFDTIGFAGKRPTNNVPEVDEIRFGATSEAVLPLDFTDPVLVSTDNASGSGVERVATFDEEIYAGTGDIRIVNETTPGTTTIPVGDPQVVITGKTLTITPTVPLPSDTYHIEIDAGALADRNGNTFAGISDPDLWEFTVDDVPPTVASFADNTHPLPILVNTSGRLIYTVTFSESIDAGTVEIADFAATAGSVPITVDSVTATGDPAVFEVAVSTLGTTGTLALEIVASTVISDLNGNDLDTTTAIPSDNTLTVNDPVPNAGGITNDFQGIIASQANPNTTGDGEGRYFHVSVHPDNAGTGWYCANDTSGTPAAPGFRKFTGPVIAYKMLGNSGNGDVTSTAGASTEDPSRITYETDDPTFDAFGQQQMRLWTTNDPGADLATGAGTSATGFASVGNYGYRDWQSAKGLVDISGLASGSVHIYYGSYNSTPTLKIILHDTDNVSADIVIEDAHSIAGGGNGDAADTGEYYLAEIDFVTDGVYDVLEYVWTSPNGRGLGTVLTGQDAVGGSPYGDWATTNAPTTGNDPAADEDGDGVSNGVEFVLGGTIGTNDLDKLPAVATTPGGDMTFTFVRDQDSVDAGVSAVIEVGTDLATWPDVFTVGADTGSSTAGVTVTDNLDGTDTVTLTVAQAPDAKKFARLKVEITP